LDPGKQITDCEAYSLSAVNLEVCSH